MCQFVICSVFSANMVYNVAYLGSGHLIHMGGGCENEVGDVKKTTSTPPPLS